MSNQNMALLDDNGVLIGFSDKKGAKGIPCPHNCDLVVGKYRWDFDKKTFLPFKSPTNEKISMEGDTLYCIASALKAIRDGDEFPTDTSLWLDRYFSDFDSKGTGKVVKHVTE